MAAEAEAWVFPLRDAALGWVYEALGSQVVGWPLTQWLRMIVPTQFAHRLVTCAVQVMGQAMRHCAKHRDRQNRLTGTRPLP